ncbi:MAG: DUF5996 family protein [Melioribacteraceae bacterium]|nr:DUF5996 family protein [Melioribacteraceae bacterium]
MQKDFTTGSIPIQTENGTEALDLNLNFIEHKLKLFFGSKRDEIDLHQPNIAVFTKTFLEKISDYGIKNFKPDEKFFSEDKSLYDQEEANKLWILFREIYFLFLEFRGSTLLETSNVNFWAHHFDIALLVFSGKIIDGKDPQDWDNSREQMNFGFSTGDQGIGQPYFYVTAYPFNEKLFETDLPGFARWQKEGWKGVAIELNKLSGDQNTGSKLLGLFDSLIKSNFG